jgi:MAPEG family
MALDPAQRTVARGMAAGAAFSALVLGVGYAVVPAPLGGLTGNVADRLRMALAADAFVLLWLVVAIGRVAKERFFSPADIDGAGMTEASPRVRVPAAILQNTLEQVVLATGAHLMLAAMLRDRDMALIPLLVGLFCVGRAAFWVGYAKGAGGRAFGFATTFYPSAFAWALAAVLVIVG